MSKNKEPNIKVDCIKWSEAQTMCRIMITPSDADELCRTTPSGLIINTELRDWLFKQITKSLSKFNKERFKK